MRIARVSVPGVEFPVYGVITGDKIELITGLPWPDISDPVAALNLADVKILAPVIPSKVVCVGKNYADHAKEMGGEVPAEPVIFIKPNTTVIGEGDYIVLPPQSVNVHHEAELAIVIGALAKNVEVDRADEVIFGYTCANDVTARDLQNSDGQWTRSKSFDTFCDLVRSAREMVSWISHMMTLLPGDVILTGTPAGVSQIVNGDSVTVTIADIGTLTNPVIVR